MSIESLERVIENSKIELERRPARKNIAMIAMALIIFLGPIFFFFNQEGNVYQTGYAPLFVGWLMICVWISHVTTNAFFISRTTELLLSIETAAAVLELSKNK